MVNKDGGINMIKFLTQHSNKESFFKELKEDEIFMYSFHDYNWDDVVKISEDHRIQIDCIKKGTEDYKKYGECSAKVINIKTKTFNYEINSNEFIEIEAQSEELAKAKLIEILFERGYIKLQEEIS